MSPLHVGALVTVGAGKVTWRIVGFWHAGREPMAQLQSVDREWVRTSSTLDHLKAVERVP